MSVTIGRTFCRCRNYLISTHAKFRSNEKYNSTSSIVDVPNPNETSDVKPKLTQKEARIYKRKNNVDRLTTKLNITGVEKEILHEHAKVLARPLQTPEGLYILSSGLAAIIVKYLSSDLRSENAIVFELSPGPGYVTRAVLEAGVPFLRVFEKRKRFLPYIEKFKKKSAGKLEIIQEDYYTLPKLERIYENNGSDINKIFYNKVKHHNWCDDPPLKIFGIVPTANEINFLRFLTNKFVKFESMFSFGRTQFLLFISEKEHAYMTAQPDDSLWQYLATSVLYQILFDIEVLHKEPRSSFFPPAQETKTRSRFGSNFMFLVRLTPKKYLLHAISPNMLHELALFVRHHFMQRKSHVIEGLNVWVPNCSEKLIKEGITSKLQFGDLTPTQVLTLFLYFSSWPEYEDCLLHKEAQTKWAEMGKESFDETEE